jgi:hypothetical protein
MVSSAQTAYPVAPIGFDAPPGICTAFYRLSPRRRPFSHFGHHVGTTGNDTDAFDVKQLEKKIIAACFGLVRAFYTLFKDQVAIEAFFGGPGRREPGMVRLDGTTGDDGVGPLVKRIGDTKLEFPGFIAAAGSRKKIVPFDVKVYRSAERLAQGRQALDGRRALQIISPGKFGKVHRLSFQHGRV